MTLSFQQRAAPNALDISPRPSDLSTNETLPKLSMRTGSITQSDRTDNSSPSTSISTGSDHSTEEVIELEVSLPLTRVAMKETSTAIKMSEIQRKCTEDEDEEQSFIQG